MCSHSCFTPRAHAAVTWHALHTGELWHLCQGLWGSQQLLGQAQVWEEIVYLPISITSQTWDVIFNARAWEHGYTQEAIQQNPCEAMARCHPALCAGVSDSDARAVLLLLLTETRRYQHYKVRD